MIWPSLFNFFVSNPALSKLVKSVLGFAPKRSIPTLAKITLKSWLAKETKDKNQEFRNGKIYLFADEFTNYNDVEIGIKAIKLLNKLGYEVEIPKHEISGRTYLSKGLLRKAKKIANKNVELLGDIVSSEHPLIGIEPSGILTFRDEYPELVDKDLLKKSKELKKNCLLFDEFFMQEVEKNKIKVDSFTKNAVEIKVHGHCHQKALASMKPTHQMLAFPTNYKIEEIKSGCCGMAGSFGYEKEHYDLSMKVGELVLFTEVKKAAKEILISAPGTSCRHQIKDGTGRTAFHPIEIMHDALEMTNDN